MVESKVLRPEWLPAVALSFALALAMVIWSPPVGDLAAQVFRTELFERAGLSIWNGSWYGGHYTLTYSLLFPPLAALLTPQLVGLFSVVSSAYLFDRIVRDRWGAAARPATLWFAAGVVTLLADGQLTFALGVAFALGSLRALQTGRSALALAAAAAAALSSPVAGAFLAGVLVAGTLGAASSSGRLRRSAAPALGSDRAGSPTPGGSPAGLPSAGGRPNYAALGAAALALVLTVAPNLAFPEPGQFPFVFSSYLAIPLWCAGALILTDGLRGEERQLRAVVIGYALAATAIWLVPNALGGNAVRLGALFGGPLLAAVLLSRRPRPTVPRPFYLAVLAVTIVGSLYWQLNASVAQIARSVGDPSTAASYFTPAARWLRQHGAAGKRIEVPSTANHWEAAYLAPSFDLARGWLRQADTARDDIFYDEGELSDRTYSAWLRSNAISYVALPDAPLDYSSEAEKRLILTEPRYLRLRFTSSHWRIYEVAHPRPLVTPIDSGRAAPGRARTMWVGRQGFALDVTRPGLFLVRVNFTPYWSISRGRGCLLSSGGWTLARTLHRGVLRVDADLSLGSAWNAVTGAAKTC